MATDKRPDRFESVRSPGSGKTAAIVSLHFSPAYASHMIALARLLRELGYTVAFVLDRKYLGFAGFSALGEVIPASEGSGYLGRGFDCAFFCNSGVRNPLVARRMRARGAAIIYIYQEPESFWNLFSEGWEQIVRFPFSTACSIATLVQCAAVVVPSARALALYNRHYRIYNRNVYAMPLLFDDEIGAVQVEAARGCKRSFGFIGSASKGHGIDEFVAFAKYAIRSGSTIPLVIATRRDLTRLLREDAELERYRSEGRIEIAHGRVMSNEEINRRYLESFCVWNLYRRSTQSGVLPRAFMAGSPVLARRIGSFPDFIREGVNGEFVDSATDPAAILKAAERMRELSSSYVDGCRKTFLETFYYKANGARLAAILESAGCARRP